MDGLFDRDVASLPAANIFGEELDNRTFLRDRFVEPPFTLLNGYSGEWAKRKQAWKRLGIKSELGRDVVTFSESIVGLRSRLDGSKPLATVSIFDPVLTELCYRWFCPDGGHILDPFAGGSVRGIVARYLGYEYCGIDLRAEQIEANYANAAEIFPDGPPPVWFTGDSLQVLRSTPRSSLFDLVFSCPPYADLEVYSDDPRDISGKQYPEFLRLYRAIIAEAVRLLKPGGFAAFVVGEVRDKRTGYYYNFVGDTVQAFVDAGAGYFNEAIIATPIGTAPLRTKGFERNRKLVKVHQNVLVFRKYGT